MDKTTEALASYGTSLRYEGLTVAAIHAAKRSIIDSLGCAMGGYQSEPSVIARRLAQGCTGTPPARVLGDGRKTSPEMAAFANTVMVRYLDANDSYNSVGSGHPSDTLGAVMAAAEVAGASGRDTILATVAAYEVFAALADQVPVREKGWDQGVFIAPAAAVGAGVLLGLSTAQMAEALSIAVTANVPTRQTRAGELSMWKGCATAAAAKAGLFAALLANEGMTGPTAAFEGHHGLWEQVTGPFQIEPLGGAGGPFGIERVNLKYFPTEYHSQAPIALALSLRDRVKAEEIEAFNVQTYWLAYSEIGSEPEKWDPRTRETADHSLPYLLAVALRDGRITPAIFEPDRFLDAGLRPLMNRIRITENPEFTRQYPKAFLSEFEVVTRSGRRIVERTGYPKGHTRNPMTDADVETKFRDYATGVLKAGAVEDALRTLWGLEQIGAMGDVLTLFTV